ncbi:hypothetical protein D3C71_1681520 [compost metagenome]
MLMAVENCVPIRCWAVPAPLEPYENLPGAALIRATSSFTSLAGVVALTVSTLGTRATVVMGAKLF